MSDSQTKRIFTQLKRSIMRKAKARGEVSAIDLQNVMRSVSGFARGALISNAFRSLEKDGQLSRAGFQDVNPSTGHRVQVYQVPASTGW